ncbi:MAG: HD domain-containing phosphohydrolase [Candidatus Accumulibacter sp. UW20]|jgi:putative two-component system response regulator
MEKLILLVDDDDPAALKLLRKALRPEFKVRSATHGKKGLALAGTLPLPDLILLDIRLPDMHGYLVCSKLKQEQLLVGNRTRDLEERTAELETRTTELQLSQELAIVALGSIAETRDNETGNHIHRTQAYVRTLTERLASLQRYRSTVSEEEWAMIWRSAPLHDIGKVGIPDHILLKPGRLSAEELQIMKRHPVIGRDALRIAETRSGSDHSFLGIAKEVAYAHHEHWDGGGYPEGIKGEAIPLSARIMALADVYDAMISKRVYKPAMSHATAVDQIRAGRGTHFDPSLVDGFLEAADQFNDIALRFSDRAAAREHAS